MREASVSDPHSVSGYWSRVVTEVLRRASVPYVQRLLVLSANDSETFVRIYESPRPRPKWILRSCRIPPARVLSRLCGRQLSDNLSSLGGPCA